MAGCAGLANNGGGSDMAKDDKERKPQNPYELLGELYKPSPKPEKKTAK